MKSASAGKGNERKEECSTGRLPPHPSPSTPASHATTARVAEFGLQEDGTTVHEDPWVRACMSHPPNDKHVATRLQVQMTLHDVDAVLRHGANVYN